MIATMGNEGLFFFFGGITSLGGVYIYFLMKETEGLTDKEKKQLYAV